jgi:hypothetical protein
MSASPNNLANLPNLAGIHACDPAASIKLARYLRRTAIPAFAGELEGGRVRADRATVLTREDLGQLRSIFADLGGIMAIQETGRPTHRVDEVRAVLARPDCTDSDSRTRLANLIRALRSGGLTDRTLTTALTDGGVVFVDGNKRAAAIYETAAATPIRLPVYLLVGTAGVISLDGLLAGRIVYI